MSRLAEITDWGFADALALGKPVFLAMFAGRSDSRRKVLLSALAELAEGCGDAVMARFVDVDENPSLAQKLSLMKLPALILYTFGAEHSRWQGGIDFDQVRGLVETLARDE
jgi:thioredoxin-like negative regulator of GroEL